MCDIAPVLATDPGLITWLVAVMGFTILVGLTSDRLGRLSRTFLKLF